MIRRLRRFDWRAVLLIAWLSAGLLTACGSAPPTPQASWVLPFPNDSACARIARPFSVENPWDHAHEAVDFACEPGTAVLAAAAGRVISVAAVEVGREIRWRIELQLMDQDIILHYQNLRSASVSEEDVVAAGEPLGESALGLHLAALDLARGDFVDPLNYLPAD